MRFFKILITSQEPYIKAMVMAIAYASNVGGLTVRCHRASIAPFFSHVGMQTPISSPQNLLGFSTINNPATWSKPGDHVSAPLNWGLFLGVTVPFALVCLALAWTFLWLFYRPKLKEIDAIPNVTPSPIGIYHIIVMVRHLRLFCIAHSPSLSRF